jgi:hypothetical protein
MNVGYHSSNKLLPQKIELDQWERAIALLVAEANASWVALGTMSNWHGAIERSTQPTKGDRANFSYRSRGLRP